MFRINYFRRVLMASFLGLTLALVACQSDTANESVSDADRANVDAMSQEHAEDTSEASPATEIAPRRAVVSERLPYGEVDDELVYGHFVFPFDMLEPLPAIIVIHEWWGLNDNVRAMADRLAGEGYIVLAVDLYGGETATTPQEARENMMSVVENPASATENIRKAYEFVSATAGAPRVGSLGWCFGGGWSLNSAMILGDDLDAAVVYYGQVTDDEDKLSAITAPMIGFFGAADRGITVESVQKFESAMERLRKNHEVHIYPGADHAFANPTGNAYNAAAADDAWQKTLEFLDLHLSVDVGDAP
ncbi:MAG: dienelactone hydrolase family protein [Gammaproteobacteria bacterium]|nr:dienelactone hydrolase family protein [Gammaproteobacteria bacterium]